MCIPKLQFQADEDKTCENLSFVQLSYIVDLNFETKSFNPIMYLHSYRVKPKWILIIHINLQISRIDHFMCSGY